MGATKTPLKNDGVKVSWDYYFQYMDKNMFQTTNQLWYVEQKTHVTTLESQGLLRCYHTLEKIWHMNTYSYDKIHRNHQVTAFFSPVQDFTTILCELEQLEPKFLWKTWPSCPLTWPWLGHLGLSDPSGQCATHLRMELRMELEKLTRYLWENERLGSL